MSRSAPQHPPKTSSLSVGTAGAAPSSLRSRRNLQQATPARHRPRGAASAEERDREKIIGNPARGRAIPRTSLLDCPGWLRLAGGFEGVKGCLTVESESSPGDNTGRPCLRVGNGGDGIRAARAGREKRLAQVNPPHAGGRNAPAPRARAKEPVEGLPYWARRNRAGGSSRRPASRFAGTSCAGDTAAEAMSRSGWKPRALPAPRCGGRSYRSRVSRNGADAGVIVPSAPPSAEPALSRAAPRQRGSVVNRLMRAKFPARALHGSETGALDPDIAMPRACAVLPRLAGGFAPRCGGVTSCALTGESAVQPERRERRSHHQSAADCSSDGRCEIRTRRAGIATRSHAWIWRHSASRASGGKPDLPALDPDIAMPRACAVLPRLAGADCAPAVFSGGV